MSRLFTVGEEVTHVADDHQCPECPDEYPAPCVCGGLIHAGSDEEDRDGAPWRLTQCDRCGRSEDEID